MVMTSLLGQTKDIHFKRKAQVFNNNTKFVKLNGLHSIKKKIQSFESEQIPLTIADGKLFDNSFPRNSCCEFCNLFINKYEESSFYACPYCSVVVHTHCYLNYTHKSNNDNNNSNYINSNNRVCNDCIEESNSLFSEQRSKKRELLQNQLQSIAATIISKTWLGHIQRRRYMYAYRAILKLQRLLRVRLSVKKFNSYRGQENRPALLRIHKIINAPDLTYLTIAIISK